METFFAEYIDVLLGFDLEYLFDTIRRSLFSSGGWSTPTDGCECIYWENFRFIFSA